MLSAGGVVLVLSEHLFSLAVFSSAVEGACGASAAHLMGFTGEIMDTSMYMKAP